MHQHGNLLSEFARRVAGPEIDSRAGYRTGDYGAPRNFSA